MEQILLNDLRSINGNFGLACYISGDDILPSEIEKMTNDELRMFYERTSLDNLKKIAYRYLKKRKLA